MDSERLFHILEELVDLHVTATLAKEITEGCYLEEAFAKAMDEIKLL